MSLLLLPMVSDVWLSTNALVVSPPARGAVAAVDVFSATFLLLSGTYLGKYRSPRDYDSPPA